METYTFTLDRLKDFYKVNLLNSLLIDNVITGKFTQFNIENDTYELSSFTLVDDNAICWYSTSEIVKKYPCRFTVQGVEFKVVSKISKIEKLSKLSITI